jgi:hypothetical protein
MEELALLQEYVAVPISGRVQYAKHLFVNPSVKMMDYVPHLEYAFALLIGQDYAVVILCVILLVPMVVNACQGTCVHAHLDGQDKHVKQM